MRIALISFRTYQYGGVEKYAYELVKHLSEKLEVHLFTNEIVGKTNAKVHLIPAIGKKDLLSVNSFMIFLKKVLKKGTFDIIHSMGPLYLHPDVASAHICQNRILAEKNNLFRDFSFFRKSYWDLRTYTAATFQKISFRNAKKVLAVSCLLARELEREYEIKPPIVLYPGIEKHFFKDFDTSFRKRKRERMSIKDSSVVILFVGSQWERKGLKQIIKCLAFLPKNTLLLIVGRGDREGYKKFATEQGVGKNVHFAGFRSNIGDYYVVSDLLVLPSLYEPFGYPVLEAMAMGLPVVVSSEVGASEIVDDGKTGYIVPSGDNTKELSRAINRIIKANPESFKVKVREKAKQFLWEGKTKKIISVYENIIEEKEKSHKQ